MVKKGIIYILFFISILSVKASENMINKDRQEKLDVGVISNQKVASFITNEKLFEENNMVIFASEKAKLSHEEAEYLVKECEKKGLDIFLTLGLMKVESDFDRMLVGTSGERGLGQIMENTARQLAKNLNLEFKPEYLFEPKYNIQLFTTHLKYLMDFYDGDIHKSLTAYNRGQNGLEKYMASRGSRRNPAISIYSDRVLEYKHAFNESYNN